MARLDIILRCKVCKRYPQARANSEMCIMCSSIFDTDEFRKFSTFIDKFYGRKSDKQT